MIPKLLGIEDKAIGVWAVGTFIIFISPVAVCCGPAYCQQRFRSSAFHRRPGSAFI